MSYQFAIRKINLLHDKYLRYGLQQHNYVLPSNLSFVSRGIKNRGNTCYIAASLQCLNLFDEQIRYLIEQSFQFDYLYAEEDFKLLNSYVDMENKGFNSLNTSNEYFDGLYSKFIDTMFEDSTLGGMFTFGEQSDAHEFLLLFMNQIDDYLIDIEMAKRGFKSSEFEIFEQIYQDYGELYRLFKNCFRFEIDQMLTCQLNGNHVKTNKQQSNHFSLDIYDDTETLDDLFAKYFEQEILEKVNCEECGKKQNFSSSCHLSKLPENCMILLKRFKVILFKS